MRSRGKAFRSWDFEIFCGLCRAYKGSLSILDGSHPSEIYRKASPETGVLYIFDMTVEKKPLLDVRSCGSSEQKISISRTRHHGTDSRSAL